ncbi:hypothetical protein JCM10049v2_007385 [Rhodotorula toruloides]
MALPLLDPLTAPTVARTRLDTLLQRHSLSLSSLLPVLSSSGAVLGGGSIPSVVYDPKSWTPRDIDIVVPQAGADAVRKYLGENGFEVTFVPPQGFESSWKRDGETFVVPYTLETWDNERKTIDLTIVGGGMSALSHIACYHSSIVLGWLDSHSLNVAFPEPSLRGQNLINIIPSKMSLLSFIEALDKYSTRGYRLVTADKGGSVKVKKEGTVQGRAFGDQKQGLTEEELRDITRRMGWSVEIA